MALAHFARLEKAIMPIEKKALDEAYATTQERASYDLPRLVIARQVADALIDANTELTALSEKLRVAREALNELESIHRWGLSPEYRTPEAPKCS